MSLVDYASSSDEDDDEGIAEEQLEQQQQQQKEKKPVEESSAPPPSIPPLGPHNQNFRSSSSSSSHQPSNGVSLPPPQLEKLPDASFLFASPSSFSSPQTITTDHSSRVAAAIAASDSRKRESNGSALAYRRTKEPKGQLPPTRNIPDTVDGKLIPPQLRGRSNVVTEDISKLFVRRDGQNLSSSN